jgi:hypothetical protein
VAGIQVFTYANLAKESTRGTAVPPTRQLYAEGTSVLDVDPGLNFHEGENAGVRTRVRRVTQTKEDVNLRLRTASGVSYDDLTIFESWLKGGLTFSGAGADKTVACVPSMTAANNPEAFTFDVGDDTQNFRVDYVMARSMKLSASLGDLTQIEADCFGQQATKAAKASPAINSSIKIPGDLWTIKFAASQAGLTGASVQNNFLIDWDLDIQTGVKPRHYMDGNLFFGQHVETDIAATLSMTVESTALAVSEFYDKWLAGTLDFVRLRAAGPSLGGSSYSTQLDLPMLWSKVEPISDEDEGINLYRVEGNLAYDPTSAASIQWTTVQSLTALP